MIILGIFVFALAMAVSDAGDYGHGGHGAHVAHGHGVVHGGHVEVVHGGHAIQHGGFGHGHGHGHGHHGGYHEEHYHSPPHYEFAYGVNDPYHGTHFGHSETKEGYNAKGAYFVHLPDGRLQKVTYYTDKWGYHPTVTYEGKAHFPSHGHGYH
ncbi:UNVERIFIED_CONTAM: hypothetical protein RMT77_000425 [Armadillidium vulgare]